MPQPDPLSYSGTILVAPPSAGGRYVVSQLIMGMMVRRGNLQVSDTCLGAASGCTTTTKHLLPYTLKPGLGSMTPDGRYISYLASPGDFTSGYIYDTCTGAAPGCTPSSISVTGSPTFSVPVISDDGRYAVYDQAGDTAHVVLHDSCLGTAAGCVPSDTVISDASIDCRNSSIGADAQYAVYTCGTNIYLQRTCAGISSCEKTVTQVTSSAKFKSSVSDGGRFVAFTATDPALDAVSRVYVFDSCNGAVGACVPQTKLVCLNADGAVANAECSLNGMSSDGSYILFYSAADNLSPGVTGAAYIVFNPLK